MYRFDVKFILFFWKCNSVDRLDSEFHCYCFLCIKICKLLSQLVKSNVNISSFLKPVWFLRFIFCPVCYIKHPFWKLCALVWLLWMHFSCSGLKCPPRCLLFLNVDYILPALRGTSDHRHHHRLHCHYLLLHCLSEVTGFFKLHFNFSCKILPSLSSS